MNAIYKVIFNRATGQPAVVSELGKGKVKSTSGKAIKLALIMGASTFSMSALATTCNLGTLKCQLDSTWSYTNNNNLNGTAIISDGNLWDISGVGSTYTGERTYVQSENLVDIASKGYAVTQNGVAVDATDLPANAYKLSLSGMRTLEVHDSVTNSTKTINVYDSGEISLKKTYDLGFSDSLMLANASSYINTRLVHVSNGTADIYLGNPSGSLPDIYRFGELRDSHIVNIDGAENNAIANWKSSQVFVISPSIDWVNTSATKKFNAESTDFVGKVTEFDNSIHYVNNLSEFKIYNDWLISKLTSGEISEGDYNNKINGAYKNTTTAYEYSILPSGANSGIYGSAEGSIIHAKGAKALGTIDTAAVIEANTGSLYSFKVLHAEEQALIVNNGKLYGTGRLAHVNTGAQFINNGLMSLGGGTTSTYNNGAYALQPVYIDGLNSMLLNNGVYNINARHSYDTKKGNDIIYGISLTNKSKGTNTGVINSGYWGTGTIKDSVSGIIRSVLVSDNASFVNEEGGSIILGVGEDGITSDYLSSESAAIQVNTNGNAVNKGNITLGSMADGVYGLIANGTDVDLVNDEKGTINITSNGNGGQYTPSQSIGIYSQNKSSGTIVNKGTIVLNGVNNIGIKAIEGAQASSSGLITVKNAASQGSLRNYGVWVEGKGSQVGISGNVNLHGDGAIGVHARNGGTINLTGNAAVNFVTGENQIGYFIYGAGSQINNSSSNPQDVSTKDSTLMRIDGGASQKGMLAYNVSGENARGIWATGKGTVVDVAAGSNLTVQGSKAQGIYTAGGATASLAKGVKATLTGSDAVVGVVDGNEYDLAGKITNSNTGTTLTNEADISSGLAGATGFITQNQGLLVNKGNIDLTTGTNNTGVKVINGQFDNQANDITVSGVAVDVEGANAKVISTGGNIIATDGDAAIRLGQGASLDLVGSGLGVVEGRGSAHGVLLDTGANGLVVNGARIDVNVSGATGNGIENRAEIAGIQLKNATINVQDGKGVRTSASLAQQNSGTINVAGNGTGLAFMAADGSTTASSVDLSDSSGLTVNLTGSGGTGVLANTANGATVKSAVNVNVTEADGGTALVVNNAAYRVEQGGTLTSASTVKAVVEAAKAKTFINSGSILASSDSALAMAFDAGVDTVLRNDKNATIRGQVLLNGGNNTVVLDDRSSLLGTATLGNGNNQVTLKDKAHADAVIAGGGDNTFTIQGSGTTYGLLDGGAGSDDALVFDAATHTINTAASLQNFERVALKNSSQVTLKEALVLTDGGIGSGSVDISANSELAVNPAAAGGFIFDPHLTGKGVLSVGLDTAQSDFAFSTNTGNNFAGTLKLGTSHYQLENINTAALKNATLQADNGSVITVGAGEQNVGGLTFNGGTVQFGAVMPGDIASSNSVTTSATGTLDIGGKGTVQVTLGGGVINHVPAVSNKKPLMEQDDQTSLVKIADALGTVTGTGGQLTLVDENGQVISNQQQLDIVQDGIKVAEGTWDYQMVSSADGITSDGLYIAYGLNALELQGTGDDALTLAVDAAAQGLQTDLRVKLTGSGDLAIDTGSAQTVSLSNGGNDYTGVTGVRSGTLRLDADGALGHTSALDISSAASVKMNGTTQTVGSLTTESGSFLTLDTGSELTISDRQRATDNSDAGTIADNTLTGAGKLNVVSGELKVEGTNMGYSGDVLLTGGAKVVLDDVAALGNSGHVTVDTAADSLMLTGTAAGALTRILDGKGTVALENGTDIVLAADNSAFDGTFSLDSGSRLEANGPQGLGTAAVNDNGTLVLNSVAAWTVDNHISGAGNLVKEGRNTVTLTQAAAQYTGDTDVNAGVLYIGDENNAVTLASSAVNVNGGAVFGGYGGTAGDITNSGTLVLGEYGVPGSTAQDFAIGGTLSNAGTVLIGQQGAKGGNTLYVGGDYNGDGGTVAFNTVLGDDNSVSDRLAIAGSTSGNTFVRVNNAGGSGAATLNGIELISVGGSSAGEFTQFGRIVAGAYDYKLTRGQGSLAGNWYLVSGDGSTVNPDPDPGPGTDPGSKPKPNPEPWVRPEAGLYGVNMAAANNLFTHRLHDRLGETHYVDALTGESKVTSMWQRNVGGHTRAKDSSGQLDTQFNRYVMQLGGDIAQWSSDGDNRYHLGVMAGYANQKSNARNHHTGYRADGSIKGYSAGVYGTWLQDNDTKTGAWVDTWLLYNWFDNTVSGKSAGGESYKSKGITASVEGGYTWKLGERDERSAYYIQPKAQAIWMGVKADDLTEANGTRVSGEGDGNIQTRLGVRTFIKGHSALDDGKKRTFEPFVEANWIHNTETFGATLNGVRVNQAGTRNIGELKAGVEGQLSPNVNLWGNVAQQVGDKGYSDSSAMLGLKVNF